METMTVDKIPTSQLQAIKAAVEAEIQRRNEIGFFEALRGVDTSHPSAGQQVCSLAAKFARGADGMVDQRIFDKYVKQGVKILHQGRN